MKVDVVVYVQGTPSNNNNYKHHVITEASPQQQVTPVIAFGQGRKASADSGNTPRLITLRKDLSLRRTKNTYVIEGGLSKNKSEVGGGCRASFVSSFDTSTKLCYFIIKW
jgi:hypothetical protein